MTTASPQPELPVTGTAPAAVELVRAFEVELLRYGRDAARVLAAPEQDPDCPLAHGYAALVHILRQTREGLARAAPLIARARALPGNPREAWLTAAIAAWQAEDLARARASLATLVAAVPDDLFAAKLLQLLYFAEGNAPGMRAVIEAVLPHHAATAEAHGMHAFALDQCGEPDAAERAAGRALALGPDPWAHHALAHVMDRQGRHAEGRDWMHAHGADWAGCSSFLYTHNWWHAALFHLALGDHDGALALYGTRVWTMRKDYCQDQINAISLLARLELAGVDVGDRWAEIATLVAPRAGDAVDGFLDLHYAYALARAGDDRGVADLLARACAGDVGGAPRWRRIMPAAAGGLVAFARGRYDEAWQLLAPVQPELRHLGGSTVQRDLFRRVALAARAGGAATDRVA